MIVQEHMLSRAASDAEMPDTMRALETQRNLPIPWFVFRPKTGPVDFRVIDPTRFKAAIYDQLCWICGQKITDHCAFVGGPLAAIQGQYSDPASHVDCAMYAAKVCPYIARPTNERREAAILPNVKGVVAVQFGNDVVTNNPGVFGILITKSFEFTGTVIRSGPPSEIRWLCEGRPAKRAEIKAAIHITMQSEQVRMHPNIVRIRKMVREFVLPIY